METEQTDLTDLTAACDTLATIVRGVADDALGAPTPCPAYTVADLLDHVGGLTVAFTAAARKERLEHPEASGDGARLEAGWRERITASLAGLAEAWRDPAAHDGMTQAGPVELPGAVAALVALDEVVVHGWDLAVATGQPYDVAPADLAACRGFVASFAPPASDAPTEDGGLFGPPVPVAPDAPALHHLIGGTGRDPHWTP